MSFRAIFVTSDISTTITGNSGSNNWQLLIVLILLIVVFSRNKISCNFTGHSADGYSVRPGVGISGRDQGFPFTLHTPDRVFNLSATSENDRDQWILVLEKVIERPLSPQDSLSKYNYLLIWLLVSSAYYNFAFLVSVRLVRKRTNTNSMNIFSSR